ncbi:enoyl-CoA hydratase/isomerase family protein [Actinomadura madurae]|uniref:enoyl-CoA hydratase/isomerase family protein n=1 Tax=Actinomadura madurae TaxID=1993 RepID=UPI0020D260A5|nr:enoyl-CoA hydratase/isomerase family protein [Actinomadura madurae]MCQ0013738.1 enoyl-CoA hydratase/isomerase family protein [Actinomadura madurae]
MSHPTTDAILVESDGPVRIVTLNRPDSRNAIVQDVKDALLRIWDDLADDLDVRAVVLTGAGSAFSAGGDIANFPNVAADGDYRRRVRLRNGRKIIDSLTNFPLPLVVAVNGPAVGLGCSIASLGDVIYASTNAFFADPHVSIGLVAGDGGAATWPLMMSLARAKEYILTGDRIPADEAYRLGLVNHVVPPEELLPSALAMAHRLAAQPPQAVQETKRALNLHIQRAAYAVLDVAMTAESESFLTDEHQARVQAFLDRSNKGSTKA